VDLAADDICANVLLNAGTTSVCVHCAAGSVLSSAFIKLFNHKQPPAVVLPVAASGGAAALFSSFVSASSSAPPASLVAGTPLAFSSFSSCFSSSSPLSSSFSPPSSDDRKDDERASELRMMETTMDLALLPRANAVAGWSLRLAALVMCRDALLPRTLPTVHFSNILQLLRNCPRCVLPLMRFTWRASFKRYSFDR
jgi:hypothetical protein